MKKFYFLISVLFLPVFLPAYQKKFNFLGLTLNQNRITTLQAISSNKNLRENKSRYLGMINEEEPFTLKISYGPIHLLNQIFIQYFDKKSYEIILLFNPKYYDFYTLTDKMEDKYGTPSLKTSHLVRWKHDTKEETITLEYPNTLKIINFEALRKLEELTSNRINIFKQTNHTSAYSNAVQLMDEL